MSDGDKVFRRIQSAARSAKDRGGPAAPTQEYLIRHVLESFLDRLTRTPHARDFILKGGILLAAYGVRRPTKDADANAASADVTAQHLVDVVRDIAAVAVDDGVVFDIDAITVQDIREQAEYPGLRVRVPATIGRWKGVALWDVSTGDPVVPAPRPVTIERILGDPITLLGYAAETSMAEKGVTILERGITSTRWRDYVDIVALGRAGFDEAELLRGPSRDTEGLCSVRLLRSWRATAQWDRRSGPRGGARRASSPSARRPSMTRPPWSQPSSTPPSPSAPGNRPPGRRSAGTSPCRTADRPFVTTHCTCLRPAH